VEPPRAVASIDLARPQPVVMVGRDVSGGGRSSEVNATSCAVRCSRLFVSLVALGGLTLLLACAGSVAMASASARSSVPPWNNAWLCLPGQSRDYCRIGLTTSVVYGTGRVHVAHVLVAKNPPIDCFYVYPTVSQQQRGNSTLAVQFPEEDAAIIQASRFSQVCRVYAPMYRQITEDGRSLNPNYNLPYEDVLAAWRYYLAHYNHGRGVVLIGHSQGSGVLEELIQKQIEGTTEQRLLVSAILLGGDVVVKDGSTDGGDFTSVPACTSSTETGCVVAYSTWSRSPPEDAGEQEVTKPSTQHVLCVNPGAPGGGSAPITPIFPGPDPKDSYP
jgi:hypothetical protein